MGADVIHVLAADCKKIVVVFQPEQKIYKPIDKKSFDAWKLDKIVKIKM